jgi:hypothetical protein
VKMMCAISTGVEKVVASAVEKYSSRKVMLAGKNACFFALGLHICAVRHTSTREVNWRMVLLRATEGRARWG